MERKWRGKVATVNVPLDYLLTYGIESTSKVMDFKTPFSQHHLPHGQISGSGSADASAVINSSNLIYLGV